MISAADSVSTNVRNTISTNVTSTVSINSDDETARYKVDCYILHKFVLVDILLFIISTICYQHAKHRSKQKNINTLTA